MAHKGATVGRTIHDHVGNVHRNRYSREGSKYYESIWDLSAQRNRQASPREANKERLSKEVGTD